MKIYLYFAAFAAVAIAVGWIYHEGGKNKGGEIERQDNRAGTRSEKDRANFDLCPDGQWDYRAKKCRS